MEDIFQKAWPEVYRPTIEETGKVTATSLGPILNGVIPLSQTMYHYPNAMLKAYTLSIASYLKRPKKHINPSSMPAFIHSQWSRGYYHWVTESLPRAMAVNSVAPDATIYIPRSYNSFHIESLRLLGVKFAHFPSYNMSTDRALVSSCPKHLGTTAGELISRLSMRLKNKSFSNTSFGRRIYVSRRNARGRKVSNENEVVEVVKRYGFEVLIPEDFSFEDQVSIFGNTEFLIGIHGAGLTNMAFMEYGGSIIELLPFRNGIFDIRPNTMSMKHDNCYITLANNIGLRYGYLQCLHDKAWYQKTNLANIQVDSVKLATLVESMLERPPLG